MILIIGSRGMLGQYLIKIFSNKPNKLKVIGWDRDNIDITNQEQANKKISEVKPDLIINSAAYNDVDGCEENYELANSINGYAPGYIANIAKNLNIPIIHYSTGYVFDGKKGNYSENEIPCPLSKYAESKFLGEKEIQKYTDKFYIIRTNQLFGNPSLGGKKSFIELMLELSSKKDKLQVVSDEISNPTYAKDLAEATYEAITKKYPYGIYHLINDGSASWRDWAKEIFKIKNINIKVEPVPSSKFPRPAKRPKNSSLLNTKFQKLRSWQEALRKYLEN
ncbi:MAG: dTDP-4-dehydrorhamnose reductase [bacterium]